MDAARRERRNHEHEDSSARWWKKIDAGTILGYAGEPQLLPSGEVRYEVSSHEPLIVPLCPSRSVAIELPNTPRIEVVDGAEIPQLCAAIVLVQPNVIGHDWRRGWTPVGGEAWDDEVSLAEESSLQIGELGDEDATLVAEPDFLAFGQTGDLPFRVVVGDR